MSYLGKKEIFTVALGSVIGWGAFMLPGNVFLPNYGVFNTLIGFTIAIGMLFFIEKSYVKVMKKVPKAGGEYSFAHDLLGKKSGFITGWGLLLAYVSIIPLNATAVPMVLDTIFPFYDKGILLYSVAGYPVYLNDILVSMGIVIAFTILNLRGIKNALLAQNICVFALLGALLLIVLFAFGKLSGDGSAEIAAFKSNFASNWGEMDTKSVIRIIAFAPWAFIGFDAVAQLSGDHKLRANVVSRMTLLAIVIGAIIYNLLNIITAFGINQQQLTDSAWATGASVRQLVGNGLFYLLAVAMFGAVISGLNGFFLSSTRLVLSMSEDLKIGKTASSSLSADNQHKEQNLLIPSWIIYFIGGCALLVPLFGRTALLWFVDLSSIGASVAYFMTCLCAFKIATTGLSKVMSVIGMAVSLFFLLVLLTPFFDSNISLPSYYTLLFWIGLGLVAYVYANKRMQAI